MKDYPPEHVEERAATDVLCVRHLPKSEDCAIDAKDSPEDDVGRYSVDPPRDLLPEPGAWRSRCVEGAACAGGPVPMSRVPNA